MNCIDEIMFCAKTVHLQWGYALRQLNCCACILLTYNATVLYEPCQEYRVYMWYTQTLPPDPKLMKVNGTHSTSVTSQRGPYFSET